MILVTETLNYEELIRLQDLVKILKLNSFNLTFVQNLGEKNLTSYMLTDNEFFKLRSFKNKKLNIFTKILNKMRKHGKIN